MTDEERAEQAFRNAFAQRADTLEPVALETPTRGRRHWPIVAAAAAVVLVAGTTTTITLLSRGDSESAVGPTSPAHGAEPGFHWVSRGDVETQVPDGWGYAVEPMDTCNYEVQKQPYVAIDASGIPISAVGCAVVGGPDAPTTTPPEAFGPLPEDDWAPHLAFDTAGSMPDQTLTYDGWTLTTKTVGTQQLRLLTDAATHPAAAHVLSSATTFDTDQNGCDATSPVQAEKFVRPSHPFDVGAVTDVDSISVCLYPRTGTQQPGLKGSRLIDGSAAEALLTAIKQAPTGGGPDSPNTCTHDLYGDTGLAVRLHTGDQTHDMYVYVDWCFGNGLDDGTNLRELTHADCNPLIGEDPTEIYSGSGASYGRCFP